MLFVIVFGVFFAHVLGTHQETLEYCVENNPINSKQTGAVCTANDISIAQVINQGPAVTCTVGTKVKINLKARFISTAKERYGVATYIALDGGDAMTGRCYGYTLHPVTTDASLVNHCNGDFDTICNGPFLDTDGDSCGDPQQGDDIWQTIPNVELTCADTNEDGTADVNACETWSNQVVGDCTGIATAPLRTKSKCFCGKLQITGLTVCLSSQRVCVGDDGQPNTYPCEPNLSARFKITSAASSTMFPVSSILYGNLYVRFHDLNQTMGMEYFDQTLMPAGFTAASPTVIREDILYPCKTTLRTGCGASLSTCNVVFNNNFIPRLFREGIYTINVDTAATLPDSTDCSGAPTLGLNLTGWTCFKKTTESSSPGEYIQYIWAKEVSGRWKVAVATSIEGTMWELFETDGVTRGSYLADVGTAVQGIPQWKNSFDLTPTYDGSSLYDFTKYDGGECGDISCDQDVEVVWAMDEQAAIGATDFTTYHKPYIEATVNKLNSTANSNILFGVGWSNGCGGATQVRKREAAPLWDQMPHIDRAIHTRGAGSVVTHPSDKSTTPDSGAAVQFTTIYKEGDGTNFEIDSIYWQYSTDGASTWNTASGGSYVTTSGVNAGTGNGNGNIEYSTTLSFNPQAAQNTYRFRAVFQVGIPSEGQVGFSGFFSNSALLSVLTDIATHPSNAMVRDGAASSIVFTSVGNSFASNPIVSSNVKWECSTNQGTSWATCDTGTFSKTTTMGTGIVTTTLAFAPTLSMTQYRFRAAFGTATSNEAILTVQEENACATSIQTITTTTTFSNAVAIGDLVWLSAVFQAPNDTPFDFNAKTYYLTINGVDKTSVVPGTVYSYRNGTGSTCLSADAFSTRWNMLGRSSCSGYLFFSGANFIADAVIPANANVTWSMQFDTMDTTDPGVVAQFDWKVSGQKFSGESIQAYGNLDVKLGDDSSFGASGDRKSVV